MKLLHLLAIVFACVVFGYAIYVAFTYEPEPRIVPASVPVVESAPVEPAPAVAPITRLAPVPANPLGAPDPVTGLYAYQTERLTDDLSKIPIALSGHSIVDALEGPAWERMQQDIRDRVLAMYRDAGSSNPELAMALLGQSVKAARQAAPDVSTWSRENPLAERLYAALCLR